MAALAAEAASHLGGKRLSQEAWEQLRGMVVRDGVRRSVISDQHRPGPDRLLVLCELDLDALKSILSNNRLPAVEARQAMLAAADQVHARLSNPLHAD